MFASLPRLGASRLPLTPKHGTKHYYKGTRTSFIDGWRTGPPGRHVLKGKSDYKIDDTKARIFIAPTELENCLLKPYVSRDVELTVPWAESIVNSYFSSWNSDPAEGAKREEVLRRLQEPAKAGGKKRRLTAGLDEKVYRILQEVQEETRAQAQQQEQ